MPSLKSLHLSLVVLVLLSAIQFGLPEPTTAQTTPNESQNFGQQLASTALERTKLTIRYDGSYHRLDYPGGDVPANIGVCTDVIIRSYRALGYDLQVLVHEDMRDNFSVYPTIWQNTKTDRNIDHRRVPNLRTFFTRHGNTIPVSQKGADYIPGDLVTWNVSRNLPHIGIVSDRQTADGKRPLIVHNIGSGPQLEDMLFDYPITGHYRYHPVE